jgi:hypothetical protein
MKRRTHLWTTLLVPLAACALIQSVSAAPAISDGPRVPDVLDLTLIREAAPGAPALVDVTVRPGLSGRLALEFIDPPGGVSDNSGEVSALTISPDANSQTRRLTVAQEPASPATLTVSLTQFTDSGEPQLVITESLALSSLAEPSEPSSDADALASFVRTLPDGRRLVERLPLSEAGRLAAAGQGSIARPPSASGDIEAPGRAERIE